MKLFVKTTLFVSAVGERLYRPSVHIYESIVGDTDATWHRHLANLTGDTQRHLADPKYSSLPRQMSHCYVDNADKRKASTLPRQYEPGRLGDMPKSASKTETETASAAKYSGKCPKRKLGRSSADDYDLRLLQAVTKVNAAFETETKSRDLASDVRRGMGEAPVMSSKNEEVGAPVFRRRRRSRPSVLAGRRSSTVSVVRRGGKSAAAARRGPASGRVPPVGASATPPAKSEGGPSVSNWVGCLTSPDDKDSDVESYVTACNSTPLLSRSSSSARKEQEAPDQNPDNRKSIQTGSGSRRRRRRRLMSPIPREPTQLEPTDQPREPRSLTWEDTATATPVLVPLPVILSVLCLYVLVGAVIFHELHGADDWSKAAFVSLAAVLTVGGWYPEARRTGRDDDGGATGTGWAWWPADSRFVYALWLVIGLTVVSACLRLTVETLQSTSNCSPSTKSPASPEPAAASCETRPS